MQSDCRRWTPDVALEAVDKAVVGREDRGVVLLDVVN